MPKPLVDSSPVTIDEMIAEARREADYRRKAWPRAHRLDPSIANRRLRVLDEIIVTLIIEKARREAQPS